VIDDLVAFLRARLDEDEQVARSATSGPWKWIGDIEARDATLCRTSPQLGVIIDVIYALGEYTAGYVVVRPEDADHIAHFDPARVLAEVAAKRRIIELHTIVHRDIGWLEDDEGEQVEMYDELPVCGHCVPKHSHFRRRDEVPVGPCPTLRLLALPFADHPDYQACWAPTR
jgi:hypothetical protein